MAGMYLFNTFFLLAIINPLLDEGLFMMFPIIAISGYSHPRYPDILLDVILCPVHLFVFSPLSCFLTLSCTPVLFSHVRWSPIVMPIIAISMLLWVPFNLSCILLVTTQIWHPYVIAACIHWLYTFLFRLSGTLFFSISLHFSLQA